jgi:EAL domain-containing protein (putative c-di-GMP-specific phosphodiesterase class I)
MLNGHSVGPSLSRSKRIRNKLFAVVVGVVAAGVPMLLFNAWLYKQGEDEATITAEWALRSAEMQLDRTVAMLRDLSAQGVDSCRASQLEAMRHALLATGPVKALMLIGPNGRVMCTDTGGPIGRHEVLSSVATANPGITLDVIWLSQQRDRFLRVRESGPPDKPSIGALVPAGLLFPHASMHGGRLPGQLRMTMADGTPIGTTGTAPKDAETPESQFLQRTQSKQYYITITALLGRDGVIASYGDLRRIAVVATGLIAAMLLMLAMVFRRHHGDNPIAEIAKAILADEFVPYYQPVVDIQSGRLLGCEVLARWRRADGSLADPVAFVSLMESSGLALELTRSLMRRVRNDLGEAAARRPDMTVAFNIAPQHFDDALILNDLGTIFDGSSIKLTQIVLELTERHQVKNLAGMRRTIAALQGLGCKIAIDDVGTGHSGLSYILKLGVDIIKIDKIFVEAIGDEGHSRAIIETLIDLAKNMRMEIIAEGVETFDQVSYLRERGITAAQGYVFAPPLPAAAYLQLLNAMDPVADAPSRGRTGAVALAPRKRAGARS